MSKNLKNPKDVEISFEILKAKLGSKIFSFVSRYDFSGYLGRKEAKKKSTTETNCRAHQTVTSCCHSAVTKKNDEEKK